MVLLLASFHEFTLFLRIVLWIAVPLIVVSLVVTTILHYRQKKKNAILSEDHPALPPTGDIDISLVSRLQKEVNHYKKRIKELQHALSFEKSTDSLSNSIPDQAPELLKLPVDEVPREVVSQDSLVPDEQHNAAYLNDLITEQKTHLQFLQQQLESRIRAFHDLELRFREQSANLAKMTAAFEHNKHQLNDLEASEAVLKKENQSQAETVARLEASLKELQLQHNQSLKLLGGGVVSETRLSAVNEGGLQVK